MDTIQKIAAYLLASSKTGAMQNLQLVQSIYLADWKSCLVRNEKIALINWELTELGPFSIDILRAITHGRDYFKIDFEGSGKIGFMTTNVSFSKDISEVKGLGLPVVSVLDFVTHAINNLSREEFVSLIYSTYPVVKGQRFSQLNLKMFAKAYKSLNSGQTDV
jgi:hypothetical protein